MLANLDTYPVIVTVQQAEIGREKGEKEEDTQKKAEVDEMQSFVGKKENQRWLWHAIDHCTGEILAYVLGWRHSGSIFEIKEVAGAFWNQKIFNRWFKNLRKTSSNGDARSK